MQGWGCGRPFSALSQLEAGGAWERYSRLALGVARLNTWNAGNRIQPQQEPGR